jgi:hypothetical protein
MNTSDTELDPTVKDKIFKDKIFPNSGLSQATPQAQPKAILLAGQPGAGKGGLARRAELELDNDLVKIDPDDFHDFYPQVGWYRENYPYTWSEETHGDTVDWAWRLVGDAVAAKNNVIYDSTLSNVDNATGLIQYFQDNGYDVGVMAIAAHKLESDLGVDHRFSKSLYQHGFGRHVPAHISDQIYNKLPDSLDQIHNKTGVPIRIFNREGDELYNSRVHPLQPGEERKTAGDELKTARNARLKDPAITQALSAGWSEQLIWHGRLRETIAEYPEVTASTAEELLSEREEYQVVEHVSHSAEKARSLVLTTRTSRIGDLDHPEGRSSLIDEIGEKGAPNTISRRAAAEAIARAHDHPQPEHEHQPEHISRDSPDVGESLVRAVNDGTIEQHGKVEKLGAVANPERADLIKSERSRSQSRSR